MTHPAEKISNSDCMNGLKEFLRREVNVFKLSFCSPGRGYPSLWFHVSSVPLYQSLSGGEVLQSLVPGPYRGVGQSGPRVPLPSARTRGVPQPGVSCPYPQTAHVMDRIRYGWYASFGQTGGFSFTMVVYKNF